LPKDAPRDADAIGRHLESIWSSHGDELFGYVLSLVRVAADAEDVLQNAFVRLARAMSAGTAIDNLRAFLYRIARNEAFRLLETRKRTPVPACDLERILVEAPHRTVDEAADLSLALADLPVEQRDVIVLKLFHGLTFEEVAAVTGVGMKTAASRYRYGLQKLGRQEEARIHVAEG